MASTARPQIRSIRPDGPSAKLSRRQALRKIAAIIEDHMTEEGLSEEEKNAKVALFASLVDGEITGKMTRHATVSKPL